MKTLFVPSLLEFHARCRCLTGFLRDRRAWVLRLGRASLTVLGLASGLGCGTPLHPEGGFIGVRKVLKEALPSQRPVPHGAQQVQTAHFTDEGAIVLRTYGRPAGATQLLPCTLVIPLPPSPAGRPPLARRVEVPPSALRLGWEPPAVTGTSPRPLPIGPTMTFKSKETYVWDWLRPQDGRTDEVRLVHRLGEVDRWELLHLHADPRTGDCRFTVFEMRPAMVTVRNSAALALLPFAFTEDVIANASMPIAMAGLVVATPVIAVFAGPHLAVFVIEQGAHAVGKVFGTVERDSP